MGDIKTEIFVADIPEILPDMMESLTDAGTITALPAVPACISQRRLTFTKRGISAVPRHWLRSIPDGSLIGFLAADEKGIIQLWGASPNGGDVKQLTFLSSSISSPINFCPNGEFASYVSDGRIYITRLSDLKTFPGPEEKEAHERPVGAVVWSPTGKELCYNRYVRNSNGMFLQIFLLKLKGIHSEEL
ncbi:MAG: hypothetical protein WDO16_09175 [Bacteroidota bacterium]